MLATTGSVFPRGVRKLVNDSAMTREPKIGALRMFCTASTKYYDVPSVNVNAKGDSVFGTLRVPLDRSEGEIGLLSQLISGTGVMFRMTPGTYNFDWHLAPRRQFIVNLDASVKVTVTSGEAKVLEKGNVFFVEDITGTGHFSQAVNAQARHSLFIPVDDVALRSLGAVAVDAKGNPIQGTAAHAAAASDSAEPEAYVFDAYGTLLDVHSVTVGPSVFGDRWKVLSQTWREKQLQYTWLRSLARGQGNYVNFETVTRESLEYALELHQESIDEPTKKKLIEDYHVLKAYPEVKNSIEHVKNSGKRAVVCTNGTNAMIEAALSHNGLLDLFDDVISADELSCYKTDPSIYQTVVDEVQIPAKLMAFVSSNGWDACGAARFGFGEAFWVNRSSLPLERLPGAGQITQRKCLRGILR
mmetsp:Transcript_5064/g.9654  ORF Transcript_5064/g.9654 Transcript_5064/m.9654 type:complete len:414 (+) Transcript_5064:14-1255(+)